MIASFYDKRHQCGYVLRLYTKFVRDYGVNKELLCEDVLHYLQHYYFIKKERYLSVGKGVGYHKIEVRLHAKVAREKSARMLSVIMIYEKDVATIIPTFVFPVQKEKIYTTQVLKSPQFANKMRVILDGYGETEYKEYVIWDTAGS